jgi:hypothetical protein
MDMDPLHESDPDDQEQDNTDESTASEDVRDVASDAPPIPELLPGGEVAGTFAELEPEPAAAIELPLPPFDFTSGSSQLAADAIPALSDLPMPPLTEQWFAGAGLQASVSLPIAEPFATAFEPSPREPTPELAYELGSNNPYAQQSPAEPGAGYRLPLTGSQANDPQAGLASGGNASQYPLLMTPPILLVAFDDRQQQIEAELEAFSERMNAMCKSHADAAVDYLRWCLYTEDRAIFGG